MVSGKEAGIPYLCPYPLFLILDVTGSAEYRNNSLFTLFFKMAFFNVVVLTQYFQDFFPLPAVCEKVPDISGNQSVVRVVNLSSNLGLFICLEYISHFFVGYDKFSIFN